VTAAAQNETSATVRRFGDREVDLSSSVAVMAVVDITPNSFHRPGSTFDFDDAMAAIRAAEAEGADWVDLGGVAYFPGPEVSEEEELDRILPAVRATRAQTDLVISVDTFRPEVARRAIDAGASVINDASGMRDPRVADAAAETGAALIITHSASGPTTASFRPAYEDVVADVTAFLARQVEAATARGVRGEQLVLDPGIDLHKNTYHSVELVRRLDEVAALGHPVLAAVSNKDFIGEALGGLPSEERLEGTLATTVFCLIGGARIVRAHDVRATVRAVRMAEVLLGMQPPAAAVHNLV
jgi:dihydropteroate synthase